MSIGYQITLEGGVRINVDTHERALAIVKGMSDDEYHIDVLENDSDTISVPELNIGEEACN